MSSLIDKAFRQFNHELTKEFKQIQEVQYSVFIRKVALEALTRLVLKTPVDTGRARANWQVTINAPATSIIDQTDKSGGSTISRELGSLSKISAETKLTRKVPTVFITNNVDYIEFLEEGSSSQAPQGMVAVTVAELRKMFP